MRSRSAAPRALWRKELRELALSRSYALLLIATSALVGHAFITAVQTYAEMSGAAGAPGALAQGLSPLDGILVPTFGAYDLSATLLLPFVVIRIFAAERADGAWTLLVQSPASVLTMVALKALALAVAWLVALVPGLVAVGLWRAYGGHVNAAELASLLAGHLLRALLTIGIAAAAAAITRQQARAAIVALGVTVGAWGLVFAAAVHGGVLARFAAFTPAATLRLFEQGLVRLDVVLVTLAVTIAALVLAATGFAPALRLSARTWRSAGVLVALVIVALGASRVRASWDLTEDRRHSFARDDEAALHRLPGTLRVEVHLGPEDPRLVDLRRDVLGKLERVVPRLEVDDALASGTGLFAARDPHYGEIWYSIGGKRTMLKSTIEPVVLATIYDLAGVAAPPRAEEATYPGYPLAAEPRGAALLFYALWPLLVLGYFWRSAGLPGAARTETAAPR